ncbi:protein-tyrosine phosphatase [Turkeypox virus]|uniref:Protein-tyrosine phosphatase n=1 Tax=Turkeypox virus TaxID=336486 RepID=A0A0M5HSP1_9POXV|nr:protein-tyrosine phosphatase [Turkeypox virus]ALA62475.1 protein-tyrosine phosphatase [Turkeypox virus]
MDEKQLYKHIITRSTDTSVKFLPCEITKITDYVYLGNYKNVIDLPRRTIFRYIINMSMLKYRLIRHDVTVLHFPLEDNDTVEISKHIDIVTDILRKCDEQKIPVLIHCMAGINRSSSMVMSYLLEIRDKNIPFIIYFLYIYHELKSIRGAFIENKSFLKQILDKYL